MSIRHYIITLVMCICIGHLIADGKNLTNKYIQIQLADYKESTLFSPEIDTIIHPPISSYDDPMFFIDGQLCQHVRRIYQDRRGHLWLGTNIYGIIRYDGDTLQYFNRTNGLHAGRVTSILEDQHGILWFGTYEGLIRFDGQDFSIYNEQDGLLDNEIWSMMIDREGLLWVGTNSGISIFDGESFESFTIPKTIVKDTTTAYAYDRITTIMQNDDDEIWIGTDGFGICRYKDGMFSHLTVADGLPGNVISELLQDNQGNIWVATFDGGVSTYDGHSFTNHTQNGMVDGVEVGGLFQDENNDIWFAAENHGVYRYDGLTFSQLKSDHGLITNGILAIYRDKERRFWFGGWGGLFKYDGTSFYSVTKDGPWK